MLFVGVAETVITPGHPVQICPFRSLPERQGKLMEPGSEEITCSALYLECGKWNVMLLSADLVWLPGDLCKRVADEIALRCGVPTERCLLTATHTHSSPQTLDSAPFYGDKDDQYLAFLAQRMVLVAERAFAVRQKGTMQYKRHRLRDVPFVNRNVFARDRFGGRVHCLRAGRLDGPVDPSVRTIVVKDALGNILSVVLGMAAHPVFNFKNRISPDYPGKIREHIRQVYGRSIPVLFFQGFDGDVRPVYYRQALLWQLFCLGRFGRWLKAFRRDLSGLEESFASRIINQLDLEELPPYTPVQAERLECRTEELAPYGDSDDPDNVVRLVRLDIPGGISLVAANAEVFSSYGHLVDAAALRAGRKAIPVGCGGGMFGYVPDAEMFRHMTGYELESWKNFGRPGPLPKGFAKQFAAVLDGLFSPARNES